MSKKPVKAPLVIAVEKILATSLENWTDGWLRAEVASLLNVPLYIHMTDEERQAAGYPVTRMEMMAYLRSKGEYK